MKRSRDERTLLTIERLMRFITVMSKKKANFSSERMDDTFAFIAGYTGAGFPYGTTWEKIGINPALSLDEKKNLYLRGCYKIPALTENQKSDLKAMLDTLDDIKVKLDVYGDLSGINELCNIADSVRGVMERIGMHVEDSDWLPF